MAFKTKSRKMLTLRDRNTVQIIERTVRIPKMHLYYLSKDTLQHEPQNYNGTHSTQH